MLDIKMLERDMTTQSRYKLDDQISGIIQEIFS